MKFKNLLLIFTERKPYHDTDTGVSWHSAVVVMCIFWFATITWVQGNACYAQTNLYTACQAAQGVPIFDGLMKYEIMPGHYLTSPQLCCDIQGYAGSDGFFKPLGCYSGNESITGLVSWTSTYGWFPRIRCQ